jgi:type II secretory pathway component GspD/PulD (secretin)
MPRIPVPRIVGVSLLALGLAAGAAAVWGADPKPSPSDDSNSKTKRLLYPVKYGSAKDLAAVLGEHFKGDAEFKAVPDSPSNFLLINVSAGALDEVVKVLEMLDRRPQAVSVEMLIAEVAAKKADGDKPDAAEQDLDAKEFTGPMADVVAKLEALRKKGLVGSVKRLQLTAVEGQPASVFLGEQKPFVAALTVTGRGTTSRNITYHNIGTKMDVTARISPDKVNAVDLKFEDSRAHVAEDGVPLGSDENNVPVRAAEFITATLNDKLSIPSGHALAAQGVKTTSKTEKAQTLVIVGARVMEPDSKPEK